jgi:segregation and condensation protein B
MPSPTLQRLNNTVSSLASAVESILLVADEPLSIRSIARVLDAEPRAIEQALQHIQAGEAQRGIRVQRHEGLLQLVTAPENAEVVRQFLTLAHPSRLSRPALETLAIVAYQQPVTRTEIEQIRGVSAERVLANLLARGLIEEVGRRKAPGSPIEYGTTFAFLELFGLSSLTNLPPLERWEADHATLSQFGLDPEMAQDPSRE